MPTTVGRIIIDPTVLGGTLSVSLTNPTGTPVTAYTDAAGTTQASWPASVSTVTTYYLPEAAPPTVVVSTRYKGLEVAGAGGSTVSIGAGRTGATSRITPTLDVKELVANLAAAATAAAPVRVTKADANLACGVTANTWHSLDPGGSAAARPLDVVIPNVSAGQWVEVSVNLYSPNAATAVYLDIFTVVAGSFVNQFGTDATGTVGWLIPASLAWQASNTARYQVQAGDIEDGSVRLRIRDKNTTTTARSIGASGGIVFEMAGTGPFG